MTYKDKIAVVMEPHYMTRCVRASKERQQATDVNYVVICCNPELNGIYSWRRNDFNEIPIWLNRGKPMYCIPLDKLTKIAELDTATDWLREEIIAVQTKFCNKYRKKKMDWVLN